jgi:hypothetical protein
VTDVPARATVAPMDELFFRLLRKYQTYDENVRLSGDGGA